MTEATAGQPGTRPGDLAQCDDGELLMLVRSLPQGSPHSLPAIYVQGFLECAETPIHLGMKNEQQHGQHS